MIEGHLTPDYIADYVKKLAWFDENPITLKVSEQQEKRRRKKIEFRKQISVKD